MTDSELLTYARDYTDKAIRNDDWLKFDLARFVADMLDDGKLTRQLLTELGFTYYERYDELRNIWLHKKVSGWWQYHDDSMPCLQWWIGNMFVETIWYPGHLRCLLRSLRVMT